jgi:hypothetical protein
MQPLKTLIDHKLRVRVEDLPEHTLENLCEALSIPNLEREKAKKMDQWGWERMPAEIELFSFDTDMLGHTRLVMPRGFLGDFATGMESCGANVELVDHRCHATGGSARPRRRGLVDLPVADGADEEDRGVGTGDHQVACGERQDAHDPDDHPGPPRAPGHRGHDQEPHHRQHEGHPLAVAGPRQGVLRRGLRGRADRRRQVRREPVDHGRHRADAPLALRRAGGRWLLRLLRARLP